MKNYNKSYKLLILILTFCMLVSSFSGAKAVRADESRNLVQNPSFESEVLYEHWTFSATPVDAAAIKGGEAAKTGDNTLWYWDDVDFSFTLSQTITGIENGRYSLSAYTQGGTNQETCTLFAKGYGGEELTARSKEKGWKDWNHVVINDILVTNNTITIGVYGNGKSGEWGTVDDFQLIKVGDLAQFTVRPVTVYTNIAEMPVLPQKVTITRNDGTSEDVAVTWRDIDEASLAEAGSFELNGTIAGTEVKAKAKIIVIEPLNIPAIENLPENFIKGMDISMLKQVEDNGGKFYENGIEKDPLLIFKEHGVNWVRLRIWNNPAGKGGGENDLATTIELSKRAKALGFKLLLDFHYSDFWTDPGKQNKPEAWKNLTGEDLENAVYSYTKDVITALKSENSLPEMVQIGNEINGGMLWPDGKNWGEDSGGFDGLAKLLNSGIKGVKDSLKQGENVKIMLHLADGGKNHTFRWFFDEITERGVEFDVIGLSFYPYWHGTPEELIYNANDISKRYNKEVVIAETAYAYTLEDGDEHGNIFGLDQQEEGGYPASLQGQATMVRTMMNAMAQVPDGKGLGIFYWEGAWIPVNGAGWQAGEGNAWENQAFFDFEGNTLPSLDVFNAVSTNKNIAPIIIQMEKVSLTTEAGTNPASLLPSAIKTVYSDGNSYKKEVTWEEIEASKYSKEGRFTVSGYLADSDIKVTAEIEVIAKQEVSYVLNPGFETDLSNWILEGTGADISSNDRHSGSKTLHYWSDAAFSFTVSQNITGLENGIYKLSAFAQGGEGENSAFIFAKNYGGEELRAKYKTKGWNEWQTPVIENIKITNGTITIGASVDGNAGNWGAIDDFKLVKVGELPRTIVAIDAVNITTDEGIAPVLPEKVKAKFSDNTTEEVSVTWNSINQVLYINAGSFTIKGIVDFYGIEAEAHIVVIGKEAGTNTDEVSNVDEKTYTDAEEPKPQEPSHTAENNKGDKPVSDETDKPAEGTGYVTETPKTEEAKTETAKGQLPKTGFLLDQTLLMIIGFSILTSGLALTVRKRRYSNK
ncbi:glycosyl hydrolase 53 family protein [Clostridium thermarum]|uniref:glycosyl hydrolase 53 family protein n=1 Tax=Clostridium thermarum TaxID=1716543 RepID=UPI001120F7F5|nr:glycosyl hydrolase 53 family protein [Clostridium thermarum]